MNSLRLFVIRKLMYFIPETRCFGFKRALYRWAGANIGEGVKICSSVKISGIGNLTILDNTWISSATIIGCSFRVTIGENCDIGPSVYIGDGTHEITPSRERMAGLDTTREIFIGNGCWLCVNSTILPGVTIGQKCVVAAGAVVTSSCADLKLLAGVPAKVIKEYTITE